MKNYENFTEFNKEQMYYYAEIRCVPDEKGGHKNVSVFQATIGGQLYETGYIPVGNVRYEGEKYIFMLAANKDESFLDKAAGVPFPENTAFLFRMSSEDSRMYERILDPALSALVFEYYRKQLGGEYPFEDANRLTTEYILKTKKAIRFEFVTKPGDGEEGTMLLRNGRGEEILFEDIGRVMYDYKYYLILGFAGDEETKKALNIPENGVFVFYWAPASEHDPFGLYLCLDEKLVEAIVQKFDEENGSEDPE